MKNLCLFASAFHSLRHANNKKEKKKKKKTSVSHDFRGPLNVRVRVHVYVLDFHLTVIYTYMYVRTVPGTVYGTRTVYVHIQASHEIRINFISAS